MSGAASSAEKPGRVALAFLSKCFSIVVSGDHNEPVLEHGLVIIPVIKGLCLRRGQNEDVILVFRRLQIGKVLQ